MAGKRDEIAGISVALSIDAVVSREICATSGRCPACASRTGWIERVMEKAAFTDSPRYPCCCTEFSLHVRRFDLAEALMPDVRQWSIIAAVGRFKRGVIKRASGIRVGLENDAGKIHPAENFSKK